MPSKDSNNSNRAKKKESEKKNNLIYTSKHVRNKENFLLLNRVDINKDIKHLNKDIKNIK